MERVAQVHSGPAVLSRVAAGAWRMADWKLTLPERLNWVWAALDAGITTFDHADIYGNHTVEALFGEALAAAPGLRSQMQLVSKCGIRLVSPARPHHRLKSYDTSAAHLVASVDASLKALRTDHLDVLLIHRPDALMDVAEVAGCFAGLRQAGKVLHFGVSNCSVTQWDLLNRQVPLVTHQLEWSPLHLAPLNDGTLDQAQMCGVRPMVWSPLAGGRVLTGTDEAARRVQTVLQRLAAEWGATPLAVALAWLLRHPAGVVPIVGSGRATTFAQAAAATTLPMDRESWYEIWSAGSGHPVA